MTNGPTVTSKAPSVRRLI
ncbi:hypothetical protein YPPY47_3776, partial [Yersinia pestis PY-47]